MPTVVAALIALIGALIQTRRHRDRNSADIHLVWWMVAVVGVASLFGAAYHIFDGPQTAELIGYTRGNGGFQWENAMGDTSIGVIGILAYWLRGHFWLCTIIVLTIQYIGDGAGHIYFGGGEQHQALQHRVSAVDGFPAADRHVGAVHLVTTHRRRCSTEGVTCTHCGSADDS